MYDLYFGMDADTYCRLYDEPEFQEGEMEEFAEGFDDGGFHGLHLSAPHVEAQTIQADLSRS